jgi:hypothetical protein
MAILRNNGQLIGTMANMTFYTRRGSDKVIVRSKGGPTSKQMKKSPSFKSARLNGKEFGTGSKFSVAVRDALYPMDEMGDPNIHATFTAIGKKIQQRDTQHALGERQLLLSQHRYMLAGLQLDQQVFLESVIRTPLNAVIDKDANSAILQLPVLEPGVNFVLPWQQPFYRITVKLATIIDGAWFGNVSQPSATYTTGWLISRDVFPGADITLQIAKPRPPSDGKTLLLSIGIETGAQESATVIKPVQYLSCAKILAAE